MGVCVRVKAKLFCEQESQVTCRQIALCQEDVSPPREVSLQGTSRRQDVEGSFRLCSPFHQPQGTHAQHQDQDRCPPEEFVGQECKKQVTWQDSWQVVDQETQCCVREEEGPAELLLGLPEG